MFFHYYYFHNHCTVGGAFLPGLLNCRNLCFSQTIRICTRFPNMCKREVSHKDKSPSTYLDLIQSGLFLNHSQVSNVSITFSFLSRASSVLHMESSARLSWPLDLAYVKSLPDVTCKTLWRFSRIWRLWHRTRMPVRNLLWDAPPAFFIHWVEWCSFSERTHDWQRPQMLKSSSSPLQDHSSTESLDSSLKHFTSVMLMIRNVQIHSSVLFLKHKNR